MRAATLFSGIGAPEQARPDWQWLWHAEIEPFPAAVLAERHPNSHNLGNVLAADFFDRVEPVDVLVGGPPCQAFSVAGLRGGLSDPRGGLSLRWVQIIHAVGPRYSVTENVPGWLSTSDNAFGCFLGALVGADDALPAPPCGTWPRTGMVAGPFQRACWRVLDAQYFGLAQRRERVFVVACPPCGGDPAALLFERKGLRGYPEKSREARQDIAPTLSVGAHGSAGHPHRQVGCESGLIPIAYGGNNTAGPIDVATALNAHSGPCGRMDFESETFVAHTLRADGFDASEDGTGRGTPLVPGGAFNWQSGGDCRGLDLRDTAMALQRQQIPAVAFQEAQTGVREYVQAGTLRANGPGHDPVGTRVRHGTAVRRLTPTECERLQGFPDGYTAIQWRGKPAADGPRYKALGNSMAVPVLRWLLTRIKAHDAVLRAAA